MYPINGLIIFSLFLTFGYLIGFLNFLNYEENKCEMTYMFEYPQFVKIFTKFDTDFPKYGLYAYSEGRLTEKARNMDFDGVPVLFVPGNAGSARQGRSLASIALRKALNSRMPYHFDYFTVNLNEEFSALNGALLYEQMKYVNLSISRILELYEGRKNRPTSVVLFGHSMGGIIIRKIVNSLPNSKLVPIVINLAAPERRLPVIMDVHVHNFYKGLEINKNKAVTYVGVSGGYSDLLIPTTLTNLRDNSSIYAVSTHVPLSWVPADHLSILWCKTTILAINRALFESVDPKTKQISLVSAFRKSVFHHHLVHNSGIKMSQKSSYQEKVPISTNGEWIERIQRQQTIKFLKGVKKMEWHMVRVVEDPKHEYLTVVALNLEVTDWIFACGAHIPLKNFRVCEKGIPLTHLSEISPSAKYKRRSLTINLHELKRNHSEITHVIFRVLPTSEPVVFYVDVYNKKSRQIEVDLPKWYIPMSKTVVIEQTSNEIINMELHLPQLTHIMQSYYLFVEPKKCVSQNHHSTASLISPWSNENIHKYFTETDKKPFNVRLYSKPQKNDQPPYIKLTLDPTCSYEISMQASITGMLGQIFRFYTPLLFTNLAVVILMTFKTQLEDMEQERSCSLFFTAIKKGAKAYHMTTAGLFITKFISTKIPINTVIKSDWIFLEEEGLDFLMLPLLIYLLSVGIIWILAFILGASIVLSESTVHKIALKFLAKSVSFNMTFSDHVMTALHKLPCIVAAALISISVSTCGGLALCVGSVFYFLKLTQMSQDYVESVVYDIIKDIGRRLKKVLSKKQAPISTELVLPVDESTEQETNLSDQKAIKDISKNISENKKETNEQMSTSEQNTENNQDSIETNETEQETNETNEFALQRQASAESQAIENESVPDDSAPEIEEIKVSPNDAIFFHSTLFLIWVAVTLLNLPSVITWAHNFKYSNVLLIDPSFIPGVLLSCCSLPLWQFDMPKIQKRGYKQLSYFITTIAILSFIYAPISLFRLNYLLTSVIVVVTLHQILAPNRNFNINIHEEPKEQKRKYEDMKAKLD